MKNALASSCLPAFLSDWVDVNSDLCVFTSVQVAKFPQSHLQGGGWYLDCSGGFVPVEEKPLYSSLSSSDLELTIVPFEELDIVELPPPPPKAPKAKGRAKNTGTQSTRSASKIPVQSPTKLQSPPSTPSVAPSAAPLAAPSLTPSASRPQIIETPSHSGTSLISLPRKRKAAILETSATSSESPTTLALIENVDMVQLMLDCDLAGAPLPAYTRIQDFIAKVRIFPISICLLCFPFIWLPYFFPSSCFLIIFSLQVGQGRSRVNTSSPAHNGIDLLFADIPENLPVPNISTDVPDWNKLHDSYYECLFAFAKSNLYDHGVLVIVHCASASVSRLIFYWAHTYDFYVAEDWFGMADLDLQSPVDPSGVVIPYPSPYPFLFCLSFRFFFFL